MFAGNTLPRGMLAAIANAEDPHGSVPQSEQDAVVAQPKSKSSGHIAVECVYIPRTLTGESDNSVEQEPRGHLPEVFRFGAELGQDFFHRHAFATLGGKPDLAFVKTPAVFVRHWLIISGSVGESAGNRIDHHFQQVADGGELAGIEMIEQLVRTLSVHGLIFPYCGLRLSSGDGNTPGILICFTCEGGF